MCVQTGSSYFCSGIMPTPVGKEGKDGSACILYTETDDHGHLRWLSNSVPWHIDILRTVPDSLQYCLAWENKWSSHICHCVNLYDTHCQKHICVSCAFSTKLNLGLLLRVRVSVFLSLMRLTTSSCVASTSVRPLTRTSSSPVWGGERYIEGGSGKGWVGGWSE